MFKSYLPAKFNTWLISFQLFSLLFGAYILFSAVAIFHICLYVLFRKTPNRFRDDPVVTTGVVFAPCNGKIIAVHQNEENIQIEISILPWREMGIFLPMSSEIKNLWRTKKEVVLELDSRSDLIGMHFIKRVLGLWPELIVTPGDKGGRQVNIGFFPFGGTLVLYLPKKYEILIKNFNEVIAGETIVAVLPEKV
jgi:phosphatidylserine decarboxylase